MVLEYLAMQRAELPRSTLRELEGFKRQRGWEKINAQFIDDSLWRFSNNSKYALKQCGDLVSDISGNNIRVISKERQTGWHFFTTTALYMLYMEPQQQLDKETKCGFLIEVTGLSRENPEEFDIQLVLDRDRYPEDMYLPDDFSVERMHVALETSSSYNYCWMGNFLSWSGKPAYRDDGKIMWGGKSFEENRGPRRMPRSVNLVVYCDIY